MYARSSFCEPAVVNTNPHGTHVIPTRLAHSTKLQQGRLLAIADEEGTVSIADTADAHSSSLNVNDAGGSGVKAQWSAHNNTVFDLLWSKACPLIVQVNQHSYSCAHMYLLARCLCLA